jgi:hypothetical protein
MTTVGGDPGSVDSGANALRSVGTAIGQTASGVSSAGHSGAAAVADSPIAGALSRFAAADSQTLTDLETETRAAATLAANAAADLATAGGAGREYAR